MVQVSSRDLETFSRMLLLRKAVNKGFTPFARRLFATEISPVIGTKIDVPVSGNVKLQDVSVLNSPVQNIIHDEKFYNRLIQDLKAKFADATQDIKAPVFSFANPGENASILQSLGNSVDNALTFFNLDKSVFGQDRVRLDVMHAVVRWQRANWRQGTKAVKTIAERRGTGKKPFPQKGRGKARQGSLRATHMVKGGRVHGPHPRDYSFKMNKKERRLGLRAALYAKFLEGNMFVVDKIPEQDNSLDSVNAFMRSVGIEGESVMFADLTKNKDLFETCKDMEQNVRVLPQIGVNVYELLLCENLVITADGLVDLQKRLDKYIERNKHKVAYVEEGKHRKLAIAQLKEAAA